MGFTGVVECVLFLTVVRYFYTSEVSPCYEFDMLLNAQTSFVSRSGWTRVDDVAFARMCTRTATDERVVVSDLSFQIPHFGRVPHLCFWPWILHVVNHILLLLIPELHILSTVDRRCKYICIY